MKSQDDRDKGFAAGQKIPTATSGLMWFERSFFRGRTTVLDIS